MKIKVSAFLAPLALAFAVTAPLWAAGQADGAAGAQSGDYYEAYSGEITTVNYLVSASENEHYVFANTIDGLVEYDKYGVLKPSLAESWSSSPDGLVWTFKIRKGAQWVRSDGSVYGDTTAADWVDAAKYLLNSDNASQTADVFYGVIKNAKAYFKKEISDFSQVGVAALDDYTLQYTLEKPVPYFLSMLTYVCFLPAKGAFIQETGDRFGTDNTTVLYNGAYIFKSFEPQSSRELVKNDKYWDASNVLIKRLVYRYNKESSTLAPELFLRGEVSYAPIPSAGLDGWMKDPAKKAQIHPSKTSAYSYFYAFNFNPKSLAAEYEPENWKIAVNDKAFRLSIFHALDRKAAMLTAEPYDPSRRLQNTITPAYFVNAGGKDYTQMGGLADLAKKDFLDKGAALSFKAQAMKELKGKATFPVKIMMPFNSGYADWTSRAQVVEQQLENLLGKDYIDVIPVSFPPTGFLSATRRAGNYCMEEVNWGPDYADPETYTDPFVAGSNYNWPEFAVGYQGKDGKSIYENKVDAAKAEVIDMAKRYELFAQAEAYLIGEAFLIPYAKGAVGGVSFEASKLEPYSSPFAPFGVSNLKFKGQRVFDKAVSTEEYQAILAKWQTERAAALKAAAK